MPTPVPRSRTTCSTIRRCREATTPVRAARADSSTLEDPRLVRIGNYEDGVTGRHDAAQGARRRSSRPSVSRARRQRVAVLLSRRGVAQQGDADAARDGARRHRATCRSTSRCSTPRPNRSTRSSPRRLPLELRLPAVERREGVHGARARSGLRLRRCSSSRRACTAARTSSALLSQLTTGRLDAVWGSRRLSVRDIEESYRFRYSASALAGTISYLGSHVLSLACLALYGRYISDTLSGVRAVRAVDVSIRASISGTSTRTSTAVAPAAAKGGNARDAGPVRPDLARSREAHQRRRGHARARDPRRPSLLAPARRTPARSRTHRSPPPPSVPSNELAPADRSRGRPRHAPGRDPAEAARPGRRQPDDRPPARALRRRRRSRGRRRASRRSSAKSGSISRGRSCR